jgi:hypothetical protein
VLDALKRILSPTRGKGDAAWARRLALRWADGRPPADTISAYELALALPNELYRPDPARISEIIAALERALAAQPAELRRP